MTQFDDDGSFLQTAVDLETGEVTWSVKCLLHKIEDLSSDPRTHVKSTTAASVILVLGRRGHWPGSQKS